MGATGKRSLGAPSLPLRVLTFVASRLLRRVTVSTRGGSDGARFAFAKPIFVAFLMGCTVSLLTSATLTARLVIPATIYWSFIPLVQIGSLYMVWRHDRGNVSFRRLIDKFFAGYTPWSIFLIGLSLIWAFLSPHNNAVEAAIANVWLFGGSVAASIASVYVDFRFFRLVLGRTPRRAGRDLLVQRLISWSTILFIIGAPTAWSEIVGRISG